MVSVSDKSYSSLTIKAVSVCVCVSQDVMSSCKYLTSNKGVYTNSNTNAANTDLNIYINAYSQHIENLTSIIIS